MCPLCQPPPPQSRQYRLLTLVAESAVRLLHPFKFQHVYIPVMPYSLVDYLEAPTPFLMGLHSLDDLDPLTQVGAGWKALACGAVALKCMVWGGSWQHSNFLASDAATCTCSLAGGSCCCGPGPGRGVTRRRPTAATLHGAPLRCAPHVAAAVSNSGDTTLMLGSQCKRRCRLASLLAPAVVSLCMRCSACQGAPILPHAADTIACLRTAHAIQGAAAAVYHRRRPDGPARRRVDSGGAHAHARRLGPPQAGVCCAPLPRVLCGCALWL